MLTTLLALAFAVALAVAYAIVAGRIDDASSGRRQIDGLTIAAALMCLVFMGTGALDAAGGSGRLAAGRADAAGPVASTGAVAVVRRRRPSLRFVAGDRRVAPGGQLAGGVPYSADPLPDAPGPAGAAASRGANSDAGERGVADAGPDGAPITRPLSLLAVGDDGLATAATAAAAPPWLPGPMVGGWPVATPRAVAYASPTPTRLAIDPLPPTALPPAPPPQALPTATPHCGRPEAIEVALRIERAEAVRRDDELVVRYTASFTNGSPFPVTVADLSVTAVSGGSGSDLYGHESKPDMVLPPADRIVVEGAVKLDKSPSPFGTTDLCIAFVGETCGLRQPYDVSRRCVTVRGF